MTYSEYDFASHTVEIDGHSIHYVDEGKGKTVLLLHGNPTWRLVRETGQELTGWEVPTQIIWGMRDPLFVPWFLDEFERRLPNHAPTLRIKDASHFLQDDTPDVITAKIKEFLQTYRTS